MTIESKSNVRPDFCAQQPGAAVERFNCRQEHCAPALQSPGPLLQGQLRPVIGAIQGYLLVYHVCRAEVQTLQEIKLIHEQQHDGGTAGGVSVLCDTTEQAPFAPSAAARSSTLRHTGLTTAPLWTHLGHLDDDGVPVQVSCQDQGAAWRARPTMRPHSATLLLQPPPEQHGGRGCD